MARFPVLSRRAVSSCVVALGLMLTVTTVLVAGPTTEPARGAGGPAGLTIERQQIEH